MAETAHLPCADIVGPVRGYGFLAADRLAGIFPESQGMLPADIVDEIAEQLVLNVGESLRSACRDVELAAALQELARSAFALRIAEMAVTGLAVRT